MNTKKRYTIKDIAAACSVSTATVSYVLNDVKTQSIRPETRNRILHYANMVGYVTSHGARALAQSRTNALGFYAPHTENGVSVLRLQRALVRAAENAGLSLVLLTDGCAQRRVTQVDAILAADLSEAEFRAVAEQNFVPVLYLRGMIDDILFYSLVFDAEALRLRAEAQSGAKRVVYAAPEPHCARYRAYLERVFDACLTPRAALCAPKSQDTLFLTESQELAAALTAQGRRCLCAGSDELPLNYDALAQKTVAVALAAVRRVDPPAEHDLRIF